MLVTPDQKILLPDRRLLVPTRCPRCGKVRRPDFRARTRRRLAPRWMRGVAAMLSGDSVQVGSDDGIRVKDDGIVIAGSGDPCCCAGVCSFCPSAPASVNMAVSGISTCPGSVTSPNGTFTLPFLQNLGGLSCRYVLQTGGVAYEFDLEQSGSLHQSVVNIQQQVNSLGYFVQINSETSSSLCSFPKTFANSFTSCSGSLAGEGGSVTVTV